MVSIWAKTQRNGWNAQEINRTILDGLGRDSGCASRPRY